MKRGIQGRLVLQRTTPEPYHAFVPAPLPPRPPLETGPQLADLDEQANRALGRLDALTRLLPDPALFLYFYVRKEAVLSSQIEGTQSSLSDLLLFEAEDTIGMPHRDVEEVSCYVAALNHGLERLRGDFPLSGRLLREIHARLLSSGRGSEQEPGEFRRSQNWIGGTHPGNALFVPPPWEDVPGCMGGLERFLHDRPTRTPALCKAALAHVQFETIHPFLDGNGRLGRLLITFILCAEGALSEPLLYLSLYFKQHREQYYDLLQRVRLEGDWEAWWHFFLEGVCHTAGQAYETARRIQTLFEEDRQRLQNAGRRAGSLLQVHAVLQRRPLVTIPSVAAELPVSEPTVATAVQHMQALGIVREVGERKRGRVYCYDQYLQLLSEGAEPL